MQRDQRALNDLAGTCKRSVKLKLSEKSNLKWTKLKLKSKMSRTEAKRSNKAKFIKTVTKSQN